MQLNKTLLGGLALVGVAAAETHTISAGKTGLVFSPDNTVAAVGDTVVFDFGSGHDVSQGPFDSPCNPSTGGIYSGLVGSTKNKFVVTINDTNPIWFYCSVSSHCQSGMVGVINPPNGKTIDDYRSRAQNANTVKPSAVGGGVLTDKVDSTSGSSVSSQSSSGSAGPSSSTPATAAGSTSGTGTGAATGTATGTAKPSGAASGLFQQDTMLNAVAGLVAAGWAGFL